ncbi:MAG TPA: bifunctional DNA-formamidopyrimidine glycosylase/DNA-(apurinic or apyrimidinic site) lyase [Bryobacteraceae bacterium]|nr:bifunctional DNA-formamidopyrimidine glycosylase/DNA-(apurinic or apyrimidinic site) lyase [Bryobacteraceae bacterium]
MPELPEVETVVRTLAPRLTGRRIVDARFSSHHVVRQKFSLLRGRVRGQQVKSVRRHGKFIVLELERGFLTVHLGMTGKLLLDSEPGPYARAVFELDQGLLVYDDIRHFGRIEWSAHPLERAAALGPDALDISLPDFLNLLKSRRARVKPLLLNQRFLRGMGNIYTDEALFEARIHPRALASSLSRERATRLYRAMVEILSTAVRLKGSSISDYVDADGQKGSFQLQHQVYGRAGEPCPICGTAIRRIVVGQRGTHYCPRCQRS